MFRVGEVIELSSIRRGREDVTSSSHESRVELHRLQVDVQDSSSSHYDMEKKNMNPYCSTEGVALRFTNYKTLFRP
jgi:hypothetical protein